MLISIIFVILCIIAINYKCLQHHHCQPPSKLSFMFIVVVFILNFISSCSFSTLSERAVLENLYDLSDLLLIFLNVTQNQRVVQREPIFLRE